MASSEPTDRGHPTTAHFEVEVPDEATLKGAVSHWDSMRRKYDQREIIFDVNLVTRIVGVRTWLIAHVHGTSRAIGYNDMLKLIAELIHEVAPQVQYFEVNHQERKTVR